MNKKNRKKIKLNIKFNQGIVICARSPSECKNCKEHCELMELSYNPFSNKDIMECFKNSERKM